MTVPIVILSRYVSRGFMQLITIESSALLLVLAVLWPHATAVAQGSTGTQTSNAQPSSQSGPAAGDAADLAKKLSNPIASLISFPLQNNFDFGMGTGSGWRYTLNIQPVIPIALNPHWNMISRTIVPFIHQGNVTGPGQSQTGLGDTVQSLFLSPNKAEPFIWGGPARPC